MPTGRMLWEPEPSFARRTNMVTYMKWLEKRGMRFDNYQELWSWSVENLESFWGSIWKYFEVADADYPVLSEHKMPGARWFEGSELNFAEHVFRDKKEGAAIIAKAEKGKGRNTTWQELERRTAAFASKLREMGVGVGDRVSAYLPNSAEAVTAFLACASVGATWSACSPDFGPPAVVDRFSQIRPKVLIAVDGYSYGGKWFDRTEAVEKIAGGLPTLKQVIGVEGKSNSPQLPNSIAFDDLVAGKESPEYEPVPFDHPLWI